MSFELPKGLPKEAAWMDERADMMAEIERLRDLEAKLRRDKDQLIDIASREMTSLRALNTELIDHLANMTGRFEKCAIVMGSDAKFVKIATEKARALLAKAQSTET